ncbi:MAG: GAP family protein [Timaviella obliquedivisa GSE-PSE-MK23-08B]|jgi:cytochrome c biogenesis protein CcdA|nr:GAP family protein [Timaviella obliquedivisa GSE-PSE-MK23-08B]
MTLLSYLVAIAAIDSFNPTATAFQIYLLTTPKPVARSIAFIAGIFLTYWAVGLLATLGLSKLINSVFMNYGEWGYAIQFTLGITFLYLGCTLNSSSDFNQSVSNKPRSLQPIYTFLLGMSVTFLEAPTAFPYLAAIDRVAHAKLSLLDLAGFLVIYNLVFVMPLIGLVGIYIAFQSRSTELLKRVNQVITKWSPKILRVLLLVVGIVLLADCIAFIVGRSFL